MKILESIDQMRDVFGDEIKEVTVSREGFRLLMREYIRDNYDNDIENPEKEIAWLTKQNSKVADIVKEGQCILNGIILRRED